LVVTNVGGHPMPIHPIALFRSTVFRDCRFLHRCRQCFPAADFASPERRRDESVASTRTAVVAGRPASVRSALRTTFRGSFDARGAMQHSNVVFQRPDAPRERDNAVIDSGTWSTAHASDAARTTACWFTTGLHNARLHWHRILWSANDVNRLHANAACARQPALHGTRYAAMNALGPLASPTRAHSPRPPLARTLPPRLFCDEWPRQARCAGTPKNTKPSVSSEAVMRH
jgi:hypothetical protein